MNHPHICTLYDVGPNYLVMEYIEGTALKGPLPKPLARPIPGTEGAGYPFWSPDSESVGFNLSGKIMRADIAGGLPLLVGDSFGLLRGGTWTSDGFIVFGTDASGTFEAPAGGGASTLLIPRDRKRGESWLWYRRSCPAENCFCTSGPTSPKMMGCLPSRLIVLPSASA